MTDQQKEEAVEFGKWILENLDICDGDYYWKEDSEGDNPMDSEDAYLVFKQFKNNRQ